MSGQTTALHAVAEALQRQAQVLERLDRRLAASERRDPEDDREREAERAATLRPLHQFSPATFLQAVPGLAGRFERPVPAEHLGDTGGTPEVQCPCGGRPVVGHGHFVACPGGCGRWFLNTGVSVRVARFDAV